MQLIVRQWKDTGRLIVLFVDLAASRGAALHYECLAYMEPQTVHIEVNLPVVLFNTRKVDKVVYEVEAAKAVFALYGAQRSWQPTQYTVAQRCSLIKCAVLRRADWELKYGAA